MKCLNCDNEAVSKGTKPAKYCSDRCRKAYKRTQDRKRTEQADTNGQSEAVKKVEQILALGDKLTPKAIECINHPVHIFFNGVPAKVTEHGTAVRQFAGPLTKEKQASRKGFND